MSNRNPFRLPTPEEMRALHVAAYRARARFLTSLFGSGVRTVKSRVARIVTQPAGRVSHA